MVSFNPACHPPHAVSFNWKGAGNLLHCQIKLRTFNQYGRFENQERVTKSFGLSKEVDSCLENPRDRGAWWAASMGLHRVRHD